VRTWATRTGGLALQLPGESTPNPPCVDPPPFPWLLRREYLADMEARYGPGDVRYLAFARGACPRGEGEVTVLTGALIASMGADQRAEFSGPTTLSLPTTASV
jgi:hypothetical protein